MEPHLSGIDLWKEVHSQNREEQQRDAHQCDEEEARDGGPVHGPGQNIAVLSAKAVEAFFESVVDGGERSAPPGPAVGAARIALFDIALPGRVRALFNG